MADILPFRALRYNSDRVAPVQAVTQPYDKITPTLQDRYYAASPFNLVRIILGRRESTDNTEDNVYTRAASYFRRWRDEGILKQDPEPSIYAYSERFRAPGSNQEQERHGFIALGRIEDYSANVVFRHEQTLAKPKADRLDLLRATRAHFGQIFMLYEDSDEIESALVASLTSGDSGRRPPTIDLTDELGVTHQVWQISDPSVIRFVRGRMQMKKLIIADGHHRYETALTYRNERRATSSANCENNNDNQAPYEYMMMTFINMKSPGIVILPTHRVVHGLADFSVGNFCEASRAFFSVDEIDPHVDSAGAASILRQAGQEATGDTPILAVTANRVFLLHHFKPGTPPPTGISDRQYSLDVVRLHRCLLAGVLHLSEESIRNQQNISYARDPAEALTQVRSGRANIGFLINPCQVEQVRDVAFAGEVMPQKSTDFYPKLLSGLTIYALD